MRRLCRSQFGFKHGTYDTFFASERLASEVRTMEEEFAFELLFILKSELNDIIESTYTLCEQLRLSNRVEHARFVVKSNLILQSMNEAMEMYRELQFGNDRRCICYERYRDTFKELIEFIASTGDAMTRRDMQLLWEFLCLTLAFKDQFFP